MAEAVALQVVVLDLADPLDPNRLPGQILPRAPAALAARHARRRAISRGRPFAPWVSCQRVLPERLELGHELTAPGHRERRRHADVVEVPGGVVEPEQERADCVPSALVPAEAGDDAIRSPLVLDLEHRTLARLIRRRRVLG